jgi:hypothetical protein
MFYIGIVTKETNSGGDYKLSFFQTSSKIMNAFIKPEVEDFTKVNQSQINIIFCNQESCRQTNRLREYI